MRLTTARVSPFTLRFTPPLQTARGLFTTRPGVILELQDDDGHTGFGESAPWPGFGTESVAESLAVLQRAELLLCGAELQPQELPAELVAHFVDAPAARAALAGALWDLGARRAGLPLAALLAARSSFEAEAALKHVRVNALLTAQGPDALREQAVQARRSGYSAAKLKLGAGTLVEDLARVRAVRDALGMEVALRGDANGAWSERQAHEALAALAEFGLEYVEQPLAAGDIDGLARLRRAAVGRIAADESASTEAGVTRLLEREAVDVLVLKPASLGGPAHALEIAVRARQAGCQVVFTQLFESAVGTRHALHCAAAWGDATTAHGLAASGLFERDLAEPLVCRRGVLSVPRGPGLGIAALEWCP